MKTRNAIYDEAEDPAILDFGIEENSALAHWGRGTRDKTLIHYVLRGYGYFNGRKVSAGEGFFICRNSMHEYHSSKKEPWTYFWVSLTGEHADGLCKKYISVDEYGIFTYNFCEKLLRFSKNFFEDHSVLGNAETHGIFYLLMSYHEKKPEISGNRHLIEAKKYFDSNFHRPLTISEIAGSSLFTFVCIIKSFPTSNPISSTWACTESILALWCMSARSDEYSPNKRIIDKRLRMANRNTGIAIVASTVILPSTLERRNDGILFEQRNFFREICVTFFKYAWREVFLIHCLWLHIFFSFKKDIIIPPFIHKNIFWK